MKFLKMKPFSFILAMLICLTISAQDINQQVYEAVKADNLYALNEVLNQEQYNVNSCFELKGSSYHLLSMAIKLEKGTIINRLLADRSVDMSKICQDKTILMYGIKYGDEKLVKRLLDAGADPEQKSAEGRTVMDYIRKYKKPELSKLFNQ